MSAAEDEQINQGEKKGRRACARARTRVFKRDRTTHKADWRKFALHYHARKLVVITNARRRVISLACEEIKFVILYGAPASLKLFRA